MKITKSAKSTSRAANAAAKKSVKEKAGAATKAATRRSTAPQSAHVAKEQALALPPALPRDQEALTAFARSLERDAALLPTRAEKAQKLDDALLAWLAAAAGADAPSAGRTHGALANAELVAARLASVLDEPGAKRVAEAAALALSGDLAGAQNAFREALSLPLSFLAARGARRALRVLDEARAVLALDALAARLSEWKKFVAPEAAARAVAAEAMSLADKHPTHALGFAALALEAHARAGDVGRELPGLVALIKHAAHAQSATRTPAVAEKALLLATAHDLAGNTKGAHAAYLRVLEMTHATPREARAAHASLAKMAARRGDLEDAKAHARALQALCAPDHGPHVGAASAPTSPHATRLSSRKGALAELAHALAPKTPNDLTSTFIGAIDLLVALPLASAAAVPLDLLVGRGASEGPVTLPGGAHDVAVLVALSDRGVELLPGLPVSFDLADDGTRLLGGVLKAHRGETRTMTRAPLARSFGVLAALAATDKHVIARAAIEAPRGLPPSRAAVAAARHEIEGMITDRTHGPTTVDDARARLMKLGWRPQHGTDTLIKEGMRVRFEPFTIAATASFHARLETNDGGAASEVAHTVHVGALGFSSGEWGLFSRGFDETIDRYLQDLEHPHLARRKAVDIDAIRRLVSLGRPVEAMPTKRAELAALAEKAQHASALLGDLVAQGRAPKAIYIGVEGIDAASKTSNGMRIKSLAEKGGYQGRWLSFKGPTAEERTQHWLARYQKHAPKAGEVFLSDRTFLGDYAYNPGATPERMHEMAADVASWQRKLRDDGVLVLNFLFDPRSDDGDPDRDEVLERPMTTFGKREARAIIARDLLERFRDDLTPEERASLEASCLGPGYNDLKSFHEGYNAMERFLAFADAIERAHPEGAKFVRIGTKVRQDGREHALDAFIAELERLKA